MVDHLHLDKVHLLLSYLHHNKEQQEPYQSLHLQMMLHKRQKLRLQNNLLLLLVLLLEVEM